MNNRYKPVSSEMTEQELDLVSGGMTSAQALVLKLEQQQQYDRHQAQLAQDRYNVAKNAINQVIKLKGNYASFYI